MPKGESGKKSIVVPGQGERGSDGEGGQRVRSTRNIARLMGLEQSCGASSPTGAPGRKELGWGGSGGSRR